MNKLSYKYIYMAISITLYSGSIQANWLEKVRNYFTEDLTGIYLRRNFPLDKPMYHSLLAVARLSNPLGYTAEAVGYSLEEWAKNALKNGVAARHKEIPKSVGFKFKFNKEKDQVNVVVFETVTDKGKIFKLNAMSAGYKLYRYGNIKLTRFIRYDSNDWQKPILRPIKYNVKKQIESMLNNFDEVPSSPPKPPTITWRYTPFEVGNILLPWAESTFQNRKISEPENANFRFKASFNSSKDKLNVVLYSQWRYPQENNKTTLDLFGLQYAYKDKKTLLTGFSRKTYSENNPIPEPVEKNIQREIEFIINQP